MLESIDINFDIIVLSETWNMEDVDIVKLSGYRIYCNESLNQNGAVLVYVKAQHQHAINNIQLGDINVT